MLFTKLLKAYSLPDQKMKNIVDRLVERCLADSGSLRSSTLSKTEILNPIRFNHILE